MFYQVWYAIHSRVVKFKYNDATEFSVKPLKIQLSSFYFSSKFVSRKMQRKRMSIHSNLIRRNVSTFHNYTFICQLWVLSKEIVQKQQFTIISSSMRARNGNKNIRGLSLYEYRYLPRLNQNNLDFLLRLGEHIQAIHTFLLKICIS